MKGQIYLITIVVIALALVGLRLASSPQTSIEQIKLLESSLQSKIFQNLWKEYENNMVISYLDDINLNTYDFSNFTRKLTQEKALRFDFLFIGSLANYSSSQINVTVLNFLHERIDFILTLNSTPEQSVSSSLEDQGLFSTNFSFTPGETYNLNFKISNQNYEQNITINTNATKNVYVGFFDLTLISDISTNKKMFQKSLVLS
ncbi:MAG: hypothetical protein QXO57_03900 [Candidatus Aenigmatarchaeota archaeon]